MPRPLTVAVVDDDPSVRKALGRLLSASRINAQPFESGQQFLDSLTGQRPDCVILDLHMPGLSGFEVQDALNRTNDALPVVIITAFDDPEIRLKCLAAGAAAYLLKPLDEKSLLSAIAKCVDTHPT